MRHLEVELSGGSGWKVWRVTSTRQATLVGDRRILRWRFASAARSALQLLRLDRDGGAV